jgi:hypothetical protein
MTALRRRGSSGACVPGPTVATHWNSRSGRARDGCLIAEAGPDGLSPHGDLGVACLVRGQMEPRPEIQDLVWDGEARPERYESYLATRSSFFTPQAAWCSSREEDRHFWERRL